VVTREGREACEGMREDRGESERLDLERESPMEK